MSARIQSVDYYYTTVPDKPGEATSILHELAGASVNLLAFSLVPIGAESTQLVLFPESVEALARAAEKSGFMLSGPQRAILVQGDDELGALIDVHKKLGDANINVYASSGVTDGKGSFGYVLYVRSEKMDDATRVLGI
jgi:hypothetical protein